MKKFIALTTLTLGLFLVFFLVALKYFGGSQLKDIIEIKGSQALKGEVHVGRADIDFWPPLSLRLEKIEVKTKPTSLTKTPMDLVINHTDISIDWSNLIHGQIVAWVKVTKPEIKITTLGAAQSKIPTAAPPKVPRASKNSLSQSLSLPFPLGFKIDIKEGDVQVAQGEEGFGAKNLNVQFSAPSLEGAWKLLVDTNFELNGAKFKTSLPMKLKSTFIFSGDSFETSQTSLSLSGLEISLNGKAELTSEVYSFDGLVDLADLASLPMPPAFLPTGKYGGGVTAKIHIEHSAVTDWTAKGTLKLNKFSAQQLDYKKEDMTISGGLTAGADVDFTFGKGLIFNKIIVSADMKDLGLVMKSNFIKPAGTPLWFNLDGREADQTLFIQKAELGLANFRAGIKGSLAAEPGRPSDLNISIGRVNLQGFEKYFPPLNSSPLTGMIELQAHLQGDLQNSKTLSVNLNPLLLENVKGAIHYSSADKNINGPISINAKAIVVAQGSQLSSASILGQADFSGLDILIKDKFKKKPGTVLKIVVSAKQKGKVIEVSKSSLITSLGPPILLQGTISEPQSPLMKLKLSLKRLNLTELSLMVPMLAEWKLAGQASADLAINGNYDFAKGVEKSFFSVTGKVAANLPQFIYKKSAGGEKDSHSSMPSAGNVGAKNTDKSTEQKSESSVGSILPDWPVMRTLRLTTALKIGKLQYNDTVFSGFDCKGNLAQGELNGSVRIQKVFNGSLNIPKVQTQLLKKAPDTIIQMAAANVDMAQALLAFAPEWKDLAKGSVTGNLSFVIPHPSRTDFLVKMQGNGSVKIADGFLSTLAFDEYVNTKLKELPGVGNDKQTVHSKGASGNLDVQFVMANGQITLNPLHILSPENNEFNATGWLNVNKTLDIRGTVYLSNAPVSGNFKEANSDSKGRLVVPAVRFFGSVFKPDIDVKETLSILLKKTMNSQGEKVKAEIGKKAGEEVKKQLQNIAIPDEAKKKLQGLFGN